MLSVHHNSQVNAGEENIYISCTIKTDHYSRISQFIQKTISPNTGSKEKSMLRDGRKFINYKFVNYRT